MWLLHRRHPDVGDQVPGRAPASERGRGARHAVRPYLPLHRLSRNRRGDPRDCVQPKRNKHMSYPAKLDGLRYERDTARKAGFLIFDRPPMNVVSFEGRSQIAAIIAAMDEDPDIRVIVIRGANGLYSSGGDIAGFLKVPRDGMHDLAWNVAAPERAKKPVV